MPSDIWKDCWKMTEQADLFQPPILVLAQRHRERFTEEFLAWLADNTHIWNAFRREALSIRKRGYTRYSSRTIVEFLRHHSAIRENSRPGAEFKINDHFAPYLARIFDLAEPHAAGLFEYRITKAVVR